MNNNTVLIVIENKDFPSGIKSFCDDLVGSKYFRNTPNQIISTRQALFKIFHSGNSFYLHELYGVKVLFFFLFNKFFKRKCVLVSHGNLVYQKQTESKLKKIIFLKLLSYLDHNNNFIQYLSKEEMSKSIRVFNNYIICPPYFIKKPEHKIPFNLEKKKLICVAAEKFYRKGFDRLIDLGKYLKQQEISIDIFGPSREFLKSNYNREIPQNIQIHGQIERDEIMERLSSYSYMILLSRSEGFPIVLLEALANKVPIIITAETNFKLFTKKYDLGHVYSDKDNKNDFIKKIKCGNPKLEIDKFFETELNPDLFKKLIKLLENK